MLKDNCCGGNVLILACSGGSNVGQMSNEAAKALTNFGIGNMFCAVGVGAGVEGLIGKTKQVDTVVAIDGCPIGCVKKGLENCGINATVYSVVTELGIEKKPGFECPPEDIATIVADIMGKLGIEGGSCSCCCGCDGA